MSIGIYKITNKINNKSYIGQSVNIRRRWRDEKKVAFNINSERYNCPLSKSFRKYGFENFNFEILKECEISELNEYEEYFISYYNTLAPNGYNLTAGGSGSKSCGTILSLNDVEEITTLLSTTMIDNKEIGRLYKVSENTISAINTGLSWHRKITYPIRTKIKKGNTKASNDKNVDIKENRSNGNARPSKNELCDIIYNSNITNAAKIYKTSPTQIRRYLDYYNIPYRIKEFKEYYRKEHNIQIKSAYKVKKEQNRKTIVYSIEGNFISIENSRSDACKKYNISSSHASSCANGHRKSADGFIVRNFIDIYPNSIDVGPSWKKSFWK